MSEKHVQMMKDWITALKSGDYIQGTGVLKESGRFLAYCCLGVAAEKFVVGQDGVEWQRGSGTNYNLFYRPDNKYLSTGTVCSTVHVLKGLKAEVPENLQTLNEILSISVKGRNSDGELDRTFVPGKLTTYSVESALIGLNDSLFDPEDNYGPVITYLESIPESVLLDL